MKIFHFRKRSVVAETKTWAVQQFLTNSKRIENQTEKKYICKTKENISSVLRNTERKNIVENKYIHIIYVQQSTCIREKSEEVAEIFYTKKEYQRNVKFLKSFCKKCIIFKFFIYTYAHIFYMYSSFVLNSVKILKEKSRILRCNKIWKLLNISWDE